MLIVAAIPRLLSYDFSLPYVDHPDEPNYYLGAQDWRGLYDNLGYFDNFYSAYLTLHFILQPLLESVGINGLGATTQVMRLIAAAVNLATLVAIALTARRGAGDLAGLAAGAAWGISPLVLANGVYALPDPFVYLFTALALWLAVEALLNPVRGHWCVWSVVAGLLAVLFKIPALPALLPGGVVALVILRREPRRGLKYVLIQVGLVAAVGLWLVFGYGIDLNNLEREGAEVQANGLANMLDAGRVFNNLAHVFIPLGSAHVTNIAILGALAYILAVRRGLKRVDSRVALLCLLVVVTTPWLASAYSRVEPIEIRYVLPATAVGCVLLGMAVAQAAYVLSAYSAHPNPDHQGRPWYLQGLGLGHLLLAVLLLAMLLPQMAASWELVQEREPPDRRAALRQWVDVNLEPGTVLVTNENHKTFNPFWGGIPYRHWVNWWMMDSIMERTPEEWREDTGISYAALPLDQMLEMEGSDAGRDYLNRMLLLRSFVGGPGRGPETVFYRLRRMDVETRVQFGGEVLLVGYDQSAEEARPGDSVTFRFYWQAVSQPDDNYSLFMHLTPLDDLTPLAQADGSPAVPERPTLAWDDPGETLISPPFTLSIPADLPAGDYRVLIGLYNYATGQRLPVSDGEGSAVGDAFELARLAVEAIQ